MRLMCSVKLGGISPFPPLLCAWLVRELPEGEVAGVPVGFSEDFQRQCHIWHELNTGQLQLQVKKRNRDAQLCGESYRDGMSHFEMSK